MCMYNNRLSYIPNIYVFIIFIKSSKLNYVVDETLKKDTKFLIRYMTIQILGSKLPTLRKIL